MHFAFPEPVAGITFARELSHWKGQPMAEPAIQTVERRSSLRRRIDKPARLLIDENSAADCIVRNLSDTGALVMVGHTTYLPESMVLVIPELNIHRKAQVKWRRARSIGLVFR